MVNADAKLNNRMFSEHKGDRTFCKLLCTWKKLFVSDHHPTNKWAIPLLLVFQNHKISDIKRQKNPTKKREFVSYISILPVSNKCTRRNVYSRWKWKDSQEETKKIGQGFKDDFKLLQFDIGFVLVHRKNWIAQRAQSLWRSSGKADVCRLRSIRRQVFFPRSFSC